MKLSIEPEHKKTLVDDLKKYNVKIERKPWSKNCDAIPDGKNTCQNCGVELKIDRYGMGIENDIWKCVKCGELHESNKSTWIDIDGTEHEVML